MLKYGILQAGPLGLPKLMILQACASRIIRRYLLLSSPLRGSTSLASPRQALWACPRSFLRLSAPLPGETSSIDSPGAGDAQVWHPPGRLSGLPKLMILQTCDSCIIRRYLLLSSLLRGTTNMASPRQALRACPKLMNLQACDTCITRQLKYGITPTRGTQVWSPLLRWSGGRPSGPAPRLMIPQVCFRTLKYGPAPPGETQAWNPHLGWSGGF